MYRVSQQSKKWYAVFFITFAGAADDIKALVRDGDPVIIVDELEDLESIGINPSEVIVVD